MSLLYLLYYLCFILSNQLKTTCGQEKGPYKCILGSIVECENPSKPYASPRSISCSPEIYYDKNRQLVKGNLTCHTGGVSTKITISKYTWENGKWLKQFQLRNLDCKISFIKFLYRSLNLKHNKRTCQLLSGKYTFSKVDFNYLNHIAVSTRTYGKMRLILETVSKKGTEICYTVTSDVVPL